jgi:hypothetical protein
MSTAVCHPSKPVYGHGLCANCYHAARFSSAIPLPHGSISSTCHPGRRHYAKGLCINCYQQKYPKDQEKAKKTRAAYFQKNKPEITRKNRAWFRDNPSKNRIYHLKSQYGLSHEQFTKLVDSQGNACALCRKSFDGHSPSVDHDHATKSVRGLLCRTCNAHLGWFEKRLDSFFELIAYLERGRKCL